MNKRHWNLVKEVVDTALTYSGKERDTYLDTVFEDKPEIEEEVREMLSLIEESQREHFMQNVRKDSGKIFEEIGSDFASPPDNDKYIGNIIDRYRITELIDVGGMGMVFKGERADGEFSQQVAIKLLKKGLDTDENIQRFKIEREILSSLNHPNIAQIYDGGITDEGLPYLVMELIDGNPINVYCNSKNFSVKDRIRLFRQICQTVDYAHKNLVIHRDLKAPNIFVTESGTIKILDFGIAKLMDSANTNFDPLETMPGRKIWTPQYASPEQIRGEHVTTSTDVYSLGVLLHYLLTDRYPIDISGKPIHAIEQLILTRDPKSPSRCIADAENAKEIAATRSTTPSELIRVLKNDLDFLVEKTLRKEPGHRYESVKQLIEELDRYETGKPLMAKSGSARYRARKFIRRNRTRLTVTALLLVTITGMSAMYAWNITQERNIAQTERDKAQQVADFLTGLFSAGNPVNAQGEVITAVDLLEIGVERADELSDQPLVQAEMLYTIGNSYRGMILPDKAVPVLERALDLQREHLPSDHADIGFTLNALGSVYWSMDNNDEAEPYLREALEMRRRLHGSSHPDVFTSLNNYALILLDLGRLDEVEEIHRENLEARKAYYGPVHAKVNFTLNNLAYLLMERGKLDEAERYYLEALDAVRELEGNNHSDTAILLNNLAHLNRLQGKLDQAEEMSRESVRIREYVYGEDHRNVAIALNGLARILQDKNELDDAAQAATRSLQIRKAFYGGDHPRIIITLNVLGSIYRDIGQFDQAEKFYLEALEMRERLNPEGNDELANAYHSVGSFYLNHRRPELASTFLSKALSMFSKVSPDNQLAFANVKKDLGKALRETGQFSESEEYLTDSYNYFTSSKEIEVRHIEDTLQELITLYKDWNKPGEAGNFENELAALQSRNE